MGTIISWTNETWNPTTGCTKVSAGCANCYAERLSLRFGWSAKPWTRANESINMVLHPERLNKPKKIKKPSRIFVNSMSDLFHRGIPDDYIAQVFEVMNECPQHVFQVLTKRPERVEHWDGPWTKNIWMGTSIEDVRSLERLEPLRSSKARIKFISFEPLVEDLGEFSLEGVDWAIVGGESGPGYRKMSHAWARNIQRVCERDGVAFFFKQSSAARTEMGISLRHTDDSFHVWQQYPGNLADPVPGEPHRYTFEDLGSMT